MLTFIVLALLAVLLGVGALSLVGAIVSFVFWVVLFPVRLLFKITFGVVGAVFGLAGGLIGGLFGLLGGLIGLVMAPVGLVIGTLVLIALTLAGVVTVATHLLPVVLFGALGWVVYRAFFARRTASGY